MENFQTGQNMYFNWAEEPQFVLNFDQQSQSTHAGHVHYGHDARNYHNSPMYTSMSHAQHHLPQHPGVQHRYGSSFTRGVGARASMGGVGGYGTGGGAGRNVNGVKARTCFRCGREGHVAVECLSESVEKPEKCFNCGKMSDHLAKDCPLPRNNGCYGCGKDDHIIRDCPEKENGENSEVSTSATSAGGSSSFSRRLGSKGHRCYQCNEEGHIARDCPDQGRGGVDRAGDNSVEKKCFECGASDHIAKFCELTRTRGNVMQCRKCHEPGHIARDCPMTASEITANMICFLCNQPGHFARNCTGLIRAA